SCRSSAPWASPTKSSTLRMSAADSAIAKWCQVVRPRIARNPASVALPMVGRIRSTRALLVALFVLTLLAASAPGVAATTTHPAVPVVIPPDLQALEQKMLALQLASERATASLSVSETPSPTGLGGGFGHVFGKASAFTTALLTMSGEVSFAPQAANLQLSFF